MELKIMKLHTGAIIPKHQTEFSAGCDLHACIPDGVISIQPKEWKKVPTGLVIEIPDGYFGGVYPRSGNAFKYGINNINSVGIVDADYRGECCVLLFNNSDKPFIVEHGDRIGQLVVQPYVKVEFNEVNTLSETERGDGGFGSTGK